MPTISFGRFIKLVLGALLLGLPIGIGVLTWLILIGSSDPVTKDRFQAVAADILVPMFAAVLVTLAATATVKGLFTVANNARLLAADKEAQPIKLFEW
jgi:hypothetical protein